METEWLPRSTRGLGATTVPGGDVPDKGGTHVHKEGTCVHKEGAADVDG